MSSPYLFRPFKNELSKKQKLHLEINQQVVEAFFAIDGSCYPEDIWLAMKVKNIDVSISSFYNRLKELVEANVIEKKPNGYNKFIYKTVAKIS